MKKKSGFTKWKLKTNNTMEDIVKECGFESLKEYHRLVCEVDLTNQINLIEFTNWKNEDGTKKGLLEIINKDQKTNLKNNTDQMKIRKIIIQFEDSTEEVIESVQTISLENKPNTITTVDGKEYISSITTEIVIVSKPD